MSGVELTSDMILEEWMYDKVGQTQKQSLCVCVCKYEKYW